MKKTTTLALLCIALLCACTQKAEKNSTLNSKQWSEKKAQEWYQAQPWIVGSNFTPSNAINQLEMWQAETFSPQIIDRELGWAKDLGFNTMRVYLHSLVWQADAQGFKGRIEQYLQIANKHNIRTIFVFFDDCWNPEASIGQQPKPQPGVHNSGWVRDPIMSQRTDTVALYTAMQPYVKDILSTFRNDKRILMWDLYNEPGNKKQINRSLPLLRKVFEWAREVNPSQPLTVSVWRLDLEELNKYAVSNSDIITYHNYRDKGNHEPWIRLLKLHNRPLICTEYMARTANSTFENTMPMLKSHRIGAINWGLVSGKTNTIYAWDTPIADGSEPAVWFHDILRPDGTPYSTQEVELIKSHTK